jgi:hypothetical protein
MLEGEGARRRRWRWEVGARRGAAAGGCSTERRQRVFLESVGVAYHLGSFFIFFT